jgi:hypothetical protein
MFFQLSFSNTSGMAFIHFPSEVLEKGFSLRELYIFGSPLAKIPPSINNCTEKQLFIRTFASYTVIANLWKICLKVTNTLLRAYCNYDVFLLKAHIGIQSATRRAPTRAFCIS